MSKSSPEAHHNTSDEQQFSPKSFVIFCLDEQGDIAFEASWGETAEDIKKFATLVSKINKGTFENMILEQIKLQAKQNNQPKELTIFNKTYKDLKKPKNLVVDPTNVELL